MIERPPALPDDAMAALTDVERFGTLVVDDRVGVVEHVLPRVVTEPETVLRQGRTVVTLAGAVERAVERQV